VKLGVYGLVVVVPAASKVTASGGPEARNGGFVLQGVVPAPEIRASSDILEYKAVSANPNATRVVTGETGVVTGRTDAVPGQMGL